MTEVLNWIQEHTLRIKYETELKLQRDLYAVLKEQSDRIFNYFNDKYPDEMGKVIGINYDDDDLERLDK